MAVTRLDERLLGAFGLAGINPVRFEACRSLSRGGVMLLLPFLMECGLLSYRNHYRQRPSGYYSFDSLFVLMAFLYLCRIKSFEATKHINPGDWGKMIGYDRIPEVKKLRGLIHEVTAQEGCARWSADLSERWVNAEEPELFYIDGHVQVYHGYLAELGKKHVSRQKLCLPGMMEYWVNSPTGMPFFFVTAQVNEKMIEMLEREIIPRLLELHPASGQLQACMDENPDYPRFTLVFDREGYSPAFFKRLWEGYRIAVITYRKNVKDTWDEALFQEMDVETSMGMAGMELHEQELVLDNLPVREVRKLSSGGHQTSIITTNKIITIVQIAAYMFGRWVQENFFRYMRQEYNIDKILQYGIDQIDGNIMVVNQEYSNITYRIKKSKEKLSRRKAKLYIHQQEMPEEIGEQSKKMAKWFKVQTELQEQMLAIEKEIEELTSGRSKMQYRIPVSQMPAENRYNRLNQESKHLQNIVKMICYRTETALANLLAPHLERSRDEIRALVKSITMLNIDLYPDYQNNTLEITLYPLANKRSNEAVRKIIDTLNLTKTKYPGTDLVLVYKIATA